MKLVRGKYGSTTVNIASKKYTQHRVVPERGEQKAGEREVVIVPQRSTARSEMVSQKSAEFPWRWKAK